MKRFLSFLLAAILLLSLCACGTQTGDDATTPTTEPVVRDPNMPKKLFAYDLNAIPIATDEMTKAELRQLVLDFFELQLSFQWKTDMEISFPKTYSGVGDKTISKDYIYGGIVYQSGGFGNLYRWLEYYDEQTGTMPMSVALAENGGYGEDAVLTDVKVDDYTGLTTYYKYRSLMALGNQCTSSSSWSWGRVINSVCFGDTCDINVYNGFIPVGCYTYSYEYEGVTYDALTIQAFGKESSSNPIGYDTDNVIADWNAANGEDAMYKCYAQLKPGDCLVSGGHAMMAKSVNIFTSRDGTVNYALSTVVVDEQIEGWGTKDFIGTTRLFQQGEVEKSYTFEQLQKADYIPFTFPEFLDENDEQDKKHLDYYMSYVDKLESRDVRYQVFTDAREKCGNGVEKAEAYCTYEGDTITYADFAAMTVGSNYSISDVFVTVTDAEGKELLRNIYRATFTNFREVSMSYGKSTWETDADGNRIPISNGVEALVDGKNIIEVTMQLSTGEILTAYKGTLTK